MLRPPLRLSRGASGSIRNLTIDGQGEPLVIVASIFSFIVSLRTTRSPASTGSAPMQLNPYLNFDGCCEAAFKFYEQVLGGKIEAMMPHAGSPMEQHVPAEWRDKIMHARLVRAARFLWGSTRPRPSSEKMTGSPLPIGFQAPPRAERTFQALADNGTVRMPIQQTFWATRFGMVVDKFGTPWMINCEAAA